MTQQMTYLLSSLKRTLGWHSCLLSLGGLTPLTAQDFLGRPDDTIPAQVELIYDRGLQFLAKSQTESGSWNDSGGAEPGVVGLCVASFLAHGQDPNNGPYAKNIRLGIDYILSKQNEKNGYIGDSMYNHAFASKTLAEAYGVLDNPKIAPALKKAVELIISAQKKNRSGGWRYTPDDKEADTTVTGCQMVTLFAARNAGLGIPDEVLKKGLAYLATNRAKDGSYGYTSSSGGKPTLTAIGSLCLSLAKDRESKGFQASLTYLKKNMDYRDRYYPYYFEYYMSQALFHADETAWKEWNTRNIRYLATIQAPEGSFPGSQGASFNTAGALLSLALNYRFLPIYEK
jgi:Prenyltransferase and squalene oxidase repeat